MLFIDDATVVAYHENSHVLLSPGYVAVAGNTILGVASDRDWLVSHLGDPSEVVDATGILLTPGFINIHQHAGLYSVSRLRGDHYEPQTFGEGFLMTAPAEGRHHPPENASMGARLALRQLAQWGSTTVLDVGCTPEIADALVEANKDFGLRLMVGLKVHERQYAYGPTGTLGYTSHGNDGGDMLASTRDFLEQVRESDSGLIGGLVVPWQVDTCGPALLRACASMAEEFDVPLQIHVSQNLFEFHEIVRKHGTTPVAFLDQLGLLSPRTILAHCFYVADNPATGWGTAGDLELIAERGASVAHCPMAYSRLGAPFLPLDTYMQRGVNVGLGTDTYPRDIVDEMRWAHLGGKLQSGRSDRCTARDVFWAATVGGADAIGRPDLGRIAPGASADLLLVDLADLRLGSVVYDPIRSLVESGNGDVLRGMMVEGRWVWGPGTSSALPHINPGQIQAEAEPAWREVPAWHWSSSSPEELYPPSYATSPSLRLVTTEAASS